MNPGLRKNIILLGIEAGEKFSSIEKMVCNEIKNVLDHVLTRM